MRHKYGHKRWTFQAVMGRELAQDVFVLYVRNIQLVSRLGARSRRRAFPATSVNWWTRSESN